MKRACLRDLLVREKALLGFVFLRSSLATCSRILLTQDNALGLDWWEACHWLRAASTKARRRAHGTLNMDSLCFSEGSSTSARLRQRPAPYRRGDGSCTNNNLSRLHLFRLLVNEPGSYNHVQGDNMHDSDPIFACCLAPAAIPGQVCLNTTSGAGCCRVDLNECSFLSVFFHFWSKNNAETWNNRSPRSKERFGTKKFRNRSPPKLFMTLLIGPRLP